MVAIRSPRVDAGSGESRPPERSATGCSRVRRRLQECLHDRPRDRRGSRAAGQALPLERDRDRDLRTLARQAGERDEPRRVLPLDAGLGRAGLAADPVARDLRRRPGAALHRAYHHVRDVSRVDGPDRASHALGLRLRDRRPPRRDDLLDDVGAHEDAGVADCPGDHRHLERRHEHALLAEGHPPGVDVRVPLRIPELALVVEPARVPLAVRRLERGALVEAELLRLVEDSLRPERLAHVAEDRVDGVLERSREREPPERPARVEVVDALPVGDAVAGVVELGLRGEAVRLERRRRRDDLERRARRIETLRGAVDEWSGGAAVGCDLRDLPEVVLDEIRVVARRRGHDEEPPVARVDRRDRAARPAELLERDLLPVEVERRHDGVADDRLAPSLVKLPLDEPAEVPLGPSQDAVHRLLEPRAGARGRRIAHDVRGQLALRVAAEVELPRVLRHDSVPREHATWCEDQATPHLELRDALDLVVLPRREPRSRPGLPVGGADDQRDDQRHRRPPHADQLAVHVGAVRTARWETSRSSASMTKFETTLEPPYETNGSVIPVSGTIRRTPPTMMNVCSAKPNVSPAARSFENPSCATSATRMPRATSARKSNSTAAAPIRPSSCAIAE